MDKDVVKPDENSTTDELVQKDADEVSIAEVQKECLISDQALLTMYGEIMNNIKSDREEIDYHIANFAEMFTNGGEATTSTKEALVNLLKLKLDTSDKMSKIADLATRIKLKASDTWQPWMKNNKTYLGESKEPAATPPNKRNLIDKIRKEKSN